MDIKQDQRFQFQGKVGEYEFNMTSFGTDFSQAQEKLVRALEEYTEMVRLAKPPTV